MLVEGHQRFGNRRERATLALRAGTQTGEVVDAEHHVLRRRRDRTTRCRGQDVVRRQHEDAGLGLRFSRQRKVHSHLVAVEVGVERRTYERMDLDGLAFDQLRLERLDTQTVQGWCTVEHHRMFGDHLFEHVPHNRARTLDHALCGLDVLRVVEIDQSLHDERLEQLERHLLRQTALVQLQLRTDDDHRTTRVVDALAEQVLTETTLLALEHVGQRLQCTVARAGDRTATTAVVEQRVDRFLEHALLVVHDDLGGAEIKQSLQTVVAVDDATVEIVEIRGSETSTIELHHRAQIRRDHRHCIKHHAERAVRGVHERLHDLQALERTSALLALAVLDDLAKLLGFGSKIKGLETCLDRSGTHATFEPLTVEILHLAVQEFVALEILDLQALEAIEHAIHALDLLIGTTTHLRHLALAGFTHLATDVGLRTLGFELCEIGFHLLRTGFDVGIATLGNVCLVLRELGLEAWQRGVATVDIDLRDHVRGEVDDLLEILRREVEQVAQTARHTLEVPDVRDRSGQLDVAHAFAAHLRACDFDATTLTDDALEADALVLTAVALPVAGGTEDLFAEETVFLRLECAVVDRLRLLDLAVRPRANVVGRCKADAEFVEEINVKHDSFPLILRSDFLDAAGLTARQVDTEFLSSAERFFVAVLHRDGNALR